MAGDDPGRTRDPGGWPVHDAAAPSEGLHPTEPSDVPARLTTERIVARMRTLGYHYFVDADGDVGGIWLGRLYHFFLLGDAQQVLQVRGRWNRRIAIERLPEVLATCDRWNRELVWPKCYVRVLDDGYIHLMTELSAPFGAGATDAQLAACIQNGLATSGLVFDALDQRYPDPAASAP